MASRWAPEVVRSTLAVKERSRFLSGVEAFRARAHALSKTQVDAFMSVVDYSEKEIRKFYKAMAEFPEIAVNLLDERDWNLCIKKPFLYSEDLFVLEGRASLAGVKHSCRAVSGFGLEHLNLGDNLGNVLALEKRRAHIFSIVMRVPECMRLRACL